MQTASRREPVKAPKNISFSAKFQSHCSETGRQCSRQTQVELGFT